MQAWIHAHQQALTLVLKKLRSAPFAHLVMAAVIGAALSLPAGLYMVLANLGNAAADIETDPQITLFMTLGANDAATKEIDNRLHKHSGIREYRFVSRETAWHDLQERNGVQGALNGLEKNPLPDAFIVHVSSSDPATADALQKEFSAWPQVEHVQLDAAWVKRLYTLLKLGEKAVMILAVLLGFALIAIIGNTIRLQILTQREEIEVSKLIGATDRFIRRPFLYAGALQGVLGGVTAWLILFVALYIFNQSVEELAQLYASDFRLHPLGLQASLILIVSAALLGWLGSYWSVSRYLSKL
ncbi:cell division transport system permease protein [Novimethylophilus kurashikiensis]|uniref:Cell division protein FtsX n=1 Tax=Novimethylophilus kurashikiensis TaxID=1825523 RepID=A0A2R5FBJ5_9PROT|nr:permease-like cell division protein FtsX [Novimethylophilus kurashikiensis]GBG15587.1 cell division transport system permease protein [Novimethylophilus kurashikiensis]